MWCWIYHQIELRHSMDARSNYEALEIMRYSVIFHRISQPSTSCCRISQPYTVRLILWRFILNLFEVIVCFSKGKPTSPGKQISVVHGQKLVRLNCGGGLKSSGAKNRQRSTIKILNDIEFRRVKLTLTEKTGKYWEYVWICMCFRVQNPTATMWENGHCNGAGVYFWSWWCHYLMASWSWKLPNTAVLGEVNSVNSWFPSDLKCGQLFFTV